jgi:hypothetical protein
MTISHDLKHVEFSDTRPAHPSVLCTVVLEPEKAAAYPQRTLTTGLQNLRSAWDDINIERQEQAMQYPVWRWVRILPP